MSNDKLALANQWLDESRPSFEEMNLNKLDFAREKEFMIQAFKANPYLLGMEPESVRNILVNAALTGITLNPNMKMAYPVPRKGKLCLDISYMGLMKIVTDTGSVKAMRASVVYSNEHFDIELGSSGFITHKPNLKSPDKGERLGAYSVATLADGSFHVHWMYAQDIIGIKNRSEAVKSGKANPWLSDEDEMWKKTVAKQHWKYLPKSERAEMAANAIASENEVNGIDFEKEKQEADSKANKAKAQTMGIDILSPDSEEDQASVAKLLSLFKHPSLPPKFKLADGSEFDCEAWHNGLQEDFQSGKLHKEKAKKAQETIWMYVQHFEKQAKTKDDENTNQNQSGE